MYFIEFIGGYEITSASKMGDMLVVSLWSIITATLATQGEFLLYFIAHKPAKFKSQIN